jgi:acyl-CoA synthetase (AMP-forming)/AMP-acid ligase II
MRGTMQDFPLTLVHLFERAERLSFDKEIVTQTGTGRERTTYGAWARRTRCLGGALDTLEVPEDARVATFAWNTARHLELYFAVPCSGRVVHTLNIRLFPEQLVYIINHAEDRVIFVDGSLAPLLWPHLEDCPTVKHVVVMDDGRGDGPATVPAHMTVHDYETLVNAGEPVEFTIDDEYRAASMCYTSGTTGHPKGVVSTHRSSVLHTFGVVATDGLGVSERDCVFPVVPMFHANAWGLAHASVATGATLVMPGPDLSPPAIAALIETERVTVAAGVPTIWMGVLPELARRDTSSLRSVVCGGSAVPLALSEAWREQVGVPILQAWGMTETGPLGTVCHIKSTLDARLDDAGRAEARTSIGQPVLGVEARVARNGGDSPSGESGELQVRGPWITASYYHDARSDDSFTDDGWLRTGDVATIDAHGYLRLVDRSKDVIKSGGEWISSVALENELMAHPAVAEAAVVAIAHPKWQERPLACVVTRDGAAVDADELLAFLDGRVARWWLPDAIVFVDEIPKTSVGKFSKKELRERFAGFQLSQADEATV